MSYDPSDDYYHSQDNPEPEDDGDGRECATCGYLFDPSEEGPLCDCCEAEVRNLKVAAHLHAHEVGLDKGWLDSKQKSRERWYRRKGNWKGEIA